MIEQTDSYTQIVYKTNRHRMDDIAIERAINTALLARRDVVRVETNEQGVQCIYVNIYNIKNKQAVEDIVRRTIVLTDEQVTNLKGEK